MQNRPLFRKHNETCTSADKTSNTFFSPAFYLQVCKMFAIVIAITFMLKTKAYFKMWIKNQLTTICKCCWGKKHRWMRHNLPTLTLRVVMRFFWCNCLGFEVCFAPETCEHHMLWFCLILRRWNHWRKKNERKCCSITWASWWCLNMVLASDFTFCFEHNTLRKTISALAWWTPSTRPKLINSADNFCVANYERWRGHTHTHTHALCQTLNTVAYL